MERDIHYYHKRHLTPEENARISKVFVRFKPSTPFVYDFIYREKETIADLLEGLSIKETANKHGISEKAVVQRLHGISRKMSAGTRRAAISILHHINGTGNFGDKFDFGVELSPNQRQLVIGVRDGLSNEEIANECSISLNAVDYHLRILYQKLGIKNDRQLMAKLHSLPVIESEEQLLLNTQKSGIIGAASTAEAELSVEDVLPDDVWDKKGRGKKTNVPSHDVQPLVSHDFHYYHKRHLTPEEYARIKAIFASFKPHHETKAAFEALTSREEEIAADLLEGLSNEETATKRKISTHTVKNHKHSIYEKISADDERSAIEILHNLNGTGNFDDNFDFGVKLSPRLREMAIGIRDGLTNEEIAYEHSLSERTVKNHIHHLYQELGVKNDGQLMAKLHSLNKFVAKQQLSEEADSKLPQKLTPREEGIAEDLLEALSRKEIAIKRGISENTVRYHVYNIHSKISADGERSAISILHRRSGIGNFDDNFDFGVELSPRSREMFIGIRDGLTSEDIARKYSISLNIVNVSLSLLYQELGVKSDGQLMAKLHSLNKASANRELAKKELSSALESEKFPAAWADHFTAKIGYKEPEFAPEISFEGNPKETLQSHEIRKRINAEHFVISGLKGNESGSLLPIPVPESKLALVLERNGFPRVWADHFAAACVVDSGKEAVEKSFRIRQKRVIDLSLQGKTPEAIGRELNPPRKLPAVMWHLNKIYDLIEMPGGGRKAQAELYKMRRIFNADDNFDLGVHFSRRERNVIKGVRDGLSDKEIAAKYIREKSPDSNSVQTVRGYLQIVYTKLGINSDGELMALLHKVEPTYSAFLQRNAEERAISRTSKWCKLVRERGSDQIGQGK